MKKLIKLFIIIQLLFSKIDGIAQSQTEILKLSSNIFSWEAENKMDSLEGLLSHKFKLHRHLGYMEVFAKDDKGWN